MSLPKRGLNQYDVNRGYKNQLDCESTGLREWIPFLLIFIDYVCHVAHLTVAYDIPSYFITNTSKTCWHLCTTISPKSIQAFVIVKSILKQMD